MRICRACSTFTPLFALSMWLIWMLFAASVGFFRIPEPWCFSAQLDLQEPPEAKTSHCSPTSGNGLSNFAASPPGLVYHGLWQIQDSWLRCWWRLGGVFILLSVCPFFVLSALVMWKMCAGVCLLVHTSSRPKTHKRSLCSLLVGGGMCSNPQARVGKVGGRAAGWVGSLLCRRGDTQWVLHHQSSVTMEYHRIIMIKISHWSYILLWVTTLVSWW